MDALSTGELVSGWRRLGLANYNQRASRIIPTADGLFMSLLFCQSPTGEIQQKASTPRLLFPGSFNPLHQGHTELAVAAQRLCDEAVQYELSIANVDKPDLGEDEVQRRLRQFHGLAPIWVTRAATFLEKATLFPGCRFIVGFDTATRLFELKYYGLDHRRRDQVLERLLELGCGFIVGGRIDRNGLFQVWDAEQAPARFAGLFQAITEERFRRDISSTELRQQASSG